VEAQKKKKKVESLEQRLLVIMGKDRRLIKLI